MGKEKTILIVDDIEINRLVLAEVFSDDCRIIEAADGKQAIDIINSDIEISAVLLDLVMPEVSGIGVLQEMNRTGKIHKIPVLLITASESDEQLLEGYNLGAVDVVRKPFMTHFLKCRVNNMIDLYRHRNELEEIVDQQVAHLNELNRSLVEKLATIIEFRDCESGEHVKRICGLTRLLLTELSRTCPEYRLSSEEIEYVARASILHDIGKISISDIILNKPGRLTKEEFEVMKQHTLKGCEILESMSNLLEPDIYRYSYDICRHHHERWDGRGYPDGLRGDEISIWAQAVSVADVYDALTSVRVYKGAYSRETALKMIANGECGAFNPKVLEAFQKIAERL